MPEKYLSGKDVDTHFKNKEAYRKYMAYIHIHHIPHHKGRVIWIGGKKHLKKCRNCKSGV
ncbi:MAG: hypothetical protein ACYDAO_02705 [Thermoplasmataceae archaeon]